MKSQHADRFCHDDSAVHYDRDVRRESHPIRAGYSALLAWVASGVRPGSRVLDLGAGTGNLDILLPPLESLVCVDVSRRMLEIAAGKLAGSQPVTFVTDDFLSYCSAATETFDFVVSTYAIHHLTDAEKSELFKHVVRLIGANGTAVFGDLMFSDGEERSRITKRHRSLGTGIDQDIEEEFFWDIACTTTELAELGWRTETKRFSELSWGILMRRA